MTKLVCQKLHLASKRHINVAAVGAGCIWRWCKQSGTHSGSAASNARSSDILWLRTASLLSCLALTVSNTDHS